MPGSRWTVLLVDDSTVLRRLAAVTLNSLSQYEVDEAPDAVEALALMRERDYDVIITDYYMPGLDGIEFVRRIRADAGYKRTPIIMVTSEHDPFVEEDARLAGVDAFVTKPFEPLEIREVLARLMQATKAPAISLRIDAQSVLDSMPFPAMVLDRHHNVILGNASFWRWTGSGLDDCGVRCVSAMHASREAPHNCPLVQCVMTGRTAEEDVVEGDSRYRVSVYPMDLHDDTGDRLYLHVARPTA